MNDSVQHDADARGPGVPLRRAGRDLEMTRLRLRQWMQKRLTGGAEVELSALQAPSGTGVANETLLFEASWQQNAKGFHRRFALRIDAAESMYLDPCFADHVRIIEALRDVPGVPIPRLHGFETDPALLGAPFYLMERIEGQVPADLPPYNASGFLYDATPSQRHALWSDAVAVLGRLHHADLQAVEFLDRPQYGRNGVEQLLNYYVASYRWAASREQPILETAIDWLQSRRPDELSGGFAWGDARIGNMIFREHRCVAVLDWDLMSLGGGLSDLGWWLLMDHANSIAFGIPRLEGLGNADETIAIWESISGLKASRIDYFVVLAAFRMAVNLIGLARLLERQGHPQAAISDLEFNSYGTHYLAQMLGLPLPGPHKFTWNGL